jgi:hypothetical protein
MIRDAWHTSASASGEERIRMSGFADRRRATTTTDINTMRKSPSDESSLKSSSGAAKGAEMGRPVGETRSPFSLRHERFTSSGHDLPLDLSSEGRTWHTRDPTERLDPIIVVVSLVGDAAGPRRGEMAEVRGVVR